MTAHTVLQQLEYFILYASLRNFRHPQLEAVYYDQAEFTPDLQKSVKRLYAQHKVGAWWKTRLAEQPYFSRSQAEATCWPLPLYEPAPAWVSEPSS